MLFDVGLTQSFLNPTTVKRLAYELDEMDVRLCVATLVGSIYRTEIVVRNGPITIYDNVFPANLVLLEIQGYDMILGMDWLAKDKATIDCEKKLLTLVTIEAEKLVCKGTNYEQAIPTISPTQAFKMFKRGCLAYLCAVEVAETQEPNPGEIPIV